MCSFLFVLLCPGPWSTLEEDFHLVLSCNVSKNIVVPKKKYKPKLARPHSGKPLATPAPLTLCKRQLAHAPSSAADLAGSVATASLLDTRLVKDKKMKCQILDKYQKECGGAYDSSITTTHLGSSNLQPPSHFELMKSSTMRPEKHKYYVADPVTFLNVVVLVVDSFFANDKLVNLSATSRLLQEVVPEVRRLLTVDWKPLLKPRINYEDQNQIDMNRVDMATALAVRSGLV